MGVRRTSVTEVAVEMQKAGMISYGRGRLHITDLRQVQMKACECHAGRVRRKPKRRQRWERGPCRARYTSDYTRRGDSD